MHVRTAILGAIALAGSSISTFADEIYITSKTDNINRRYYFVVRLERTIKLLNTIKQQNSKLFMMNKTIDFNTLLKFDDAPTFHHKRIQTSIEQMKRDKTLKPLYDVWDDFAAYKFLEDELFIDEFTKEIFVISRNLLMQMIPLETRHPANQVSTELSRRSWGSSDTATLDYIDRMTDVLEQADKGQRVIIRKPHTLSSYRLPDLCKEVHTDEVSTRFYYIKRMMKSLENVKDLGAYNHSAFKFGLSPDNPFTIFDNTIELTHDRIIRCIETMEDENSLEPIFGLWDDYKQFKFIQDERFDREFFITIYLLYKNIAVNNNLSETTRSSLSDAVALYEKLNSLPVEEIIEAIDTLVEIVELAGLNKPISWRQWSREYWWVPPIFLGTIAWGYWSRR